MYKIIIILFLISSIVGKYHAQAKLDITRVQNLPDTVTLHEIRNVSATLKNIGNLSFSGLVYFDVKIDSGNGGTPVFFRVDSVFANLAALGGLDSILAFAIVPIELPAGFKVAGNGNTVVIWPRAKNLIIPNDSIVLHVYVKDNPVYVKDLGEFADNLNIMPNPSKDFISISSKQIKAIQSYKIIDITGRVMQEAVFEERLSIEKINSGMYFIQFYDNTKRILAVKKIMKE
jgi:Secretion system C-terminal sorting domain